LCCLIEYQGIFDRCTTGFPQGSVIGPSLANFVLDGLESIVIADKKTAFDEEKYIHYKNKGYDYNKNRSIVRKVLRSNVIRYADDFVIVTNDLNLSTLVFNKVVEFLKIRGLSINKYKSLILP